MHTDNRSMFGSSGGIAVLLDVCKHHMKNSAVMRQACGAIRNACDNNGMCVDSVIASSMSGPLNVCVISMVGNTFYET